MSGKVVFTTSKLLILISEFLGLKWQHKAGKKICYDEIPLSEEPDNVMAWKLFTLPPQQLQVSFNSLKLEGPLYTCRSHRSNCRGQEGEVPCQSRVNNRALQQPSEHLVCTNID